MADLVSITTPPKQILSSFPSPVSKRKRAVPNAPSTMPNPDLRIGTSETVSGAMVVVSYSKPRGVLSYT